MTIEEFMAGVAPMMRKEEWKDIKGYEGKYKISNYGNVYSFFVMFDDEGNRSPYKNCRPVSRDEVTFYEDKKDE